MLNKLRRGINFFALRSVFLSWDFVASLLIFLCVLFFSPDGISNEAARDIYNVGVTSLSIIFSVYFAALAIIISSGDNDFIDFFDQEGDYSRLVSGFRFVLKVLFISLLIAIVLYGISTIFFYEKKSIQPKFMIAIFSFFTPYGLLATFLASNDAIEYALTRIKYLRLKRLGKSCQTDDEKM